MAAKSYINYKVEDLANLGLLLKTTILFDAIKKIHPSSWLEETLKINLTNPIATEKAKSEMIVVPILNELRLINGEELTFFSGYQFDVDRSKGLNGFCDFLLCKQHRSPIINAPVFCVVEAKNGEIEKGLAQCIAEMYAARIFNEQKGHPVPFVFGTITTGYNWQFLKLIDNQVIIHQDLLFLSEVDVLLGFLQEIVNQF